MTLRELVDGVWIETGPVSIVGMPLTSTMTVLQLDRGLLVHSPLPLTPERREAVEKIGEVTHLYAPNTFHHMWIGEWVATFPRARLHAPKGLAKKRPDLSLDEKSAALDSELARELDEIEIGGFRLEERALVHRASRTLVVADLVHNIGEPPETWTKIYAGAMGFYGTIGLSRVIRWTAFADRAAARRSIDEVLGRSFDRVVVGHGTPIGAGARDALATAYAWLRA